MPEYSSWRKRHWFTGTGPPLCHKKLVHISTNLSNPVKVIPEHTREGFCAKQWILSTDFGSQQQANRGTALLQEAIKVLCHSLWAIPFCDCRTAYGLHTELVLPRNISRKSRNWITLVLLCTCYNVERVSVGLNYMRLERRNLNSYQIQQNQNGIIFKGILSPQPHSLILRNGAFRYINCLLAWANLADI